MSTTAKYSFLITKMIEQFKREEQAYIKAERSVRESERALQREIQTYVHTENKKMRDAVPNKKGTVYPQYIYLGYELALRVMYVVRGATHEHKLTAKVNRYHSHFTRPEANRLRAVVLAKRVKTPTIVDDLAKLAKKHGFKLEKR